MATSLEKIQEFKHELMQPPGPNADGIELGLRSLVMYGGPMLEQVLPDDPEDLDRGLEVIATQLLSMRSDDAPPLELTRPAGLLEKTAE